RQRARHHHHLHRRAGRCRRHPYRHAPQATRLIMTHPATARPEVSALSSSRIRDIANTAMGREDVLPFWFGESDLPTPDFIREAARRALAESRTFYTQNLGLPELREAIAAYASRLHGIPVPPDHIAVTGSGVSALMIANQL